MKIKVDRCNQHVLQYSYEQPVNHYILTRVQPVTQFLGDFMADFGRKTSSITIADIARELGVSKTTISRAISGKGRIGEETRVRVQSWIRKHNYTPNTIARGLASSKTYNVAIVIPKDSDKGDVPFFQDCLVGISEVIARRGYDALLSIVSGDDISTLERMVRNHKVDGVILTRLLENDWAAEFLTGERIPYVVLGTSDDDSICQIDSDHTAGCYEITMKALKSGSKRLILLGGDETHVVNKSRYEGFKKAFADFEDDSVKPVDVLWNLNDAEAVNKQMPDVMREVPQCLVCMDDVICARVLLYLQQNEYEIPEDVQVVSFYDSPFLENHTPPITALSVSAAVLSKTAGNVLLDLVENKPVSQRTKVAYQIKLRNSTC